MSNHELEQNLQSRFVDVFNLKVSFKGKINNLKHRKASMDDTNDLLVSTEKQQILEINAAKKRRK